MYNIEAHLDNLKAHSELPNSKEFAEVYLGDTTIDISGKECKVRVTRNKSGNIEIEPIDKDIESKGGWLSEGTCTEGHNREVILTQFRP